MNNLYESIKGVISPDICSEDVGRYFLKRLEEGKLTRDENPISHFCLNFLSYNPVNKQIFVVHHKKSNLWLIPGGHIDKGENLMQALNREIQEELGIANKIKDKIKPFLLTITPIDRPVQPCKDHLDVWYRFPTDGAEFNLGLEEFLDTKWLGLNEARKLITDPPTLQALDKMGKLFTS